MSRELNKFARPVNDAAERPPPTAVRYFYASSASIDDPKAPVPPPATSNTILPLRPFTEQDNATLDRAWVQLRRNLLKYKEEKDALEFKLPANRARRPSSVRSQHNGRERRGASMSEASRDSSQALKDWNGSSSIPGKRSASPRCRSGSFGEESVHGDGQKHSRGPSKLRESSSMADSDLEEQGLTGRPFARAPSRKQILTTKQIQAMDHENPGWNEIDDDRFGTHTSEPEPSTKVPVGVSRLHQVTMPKLQMEPIYWNPLHDISPVVRGTWFHKDTMLPVEAEVANMLERGYLDLRPWTETWRDELNSAVEAGSIGEERIAHVLWPEAALKPSSRPGTAQATGFGTITSIMGATSLMGVDDTPEKRKKELLDATSLLIDVSTGDLDVDNKAAGESGAPGQKKLYLRSKIIYANEVEAYILRQSLQPSAYYGRRPLANYVKKGHNIGLCVVRGFDQKLWDKLHPSLPEKGVEKPTLDPYMNMSLSRTPQGQVTDLVLVIHGIGQKLSERMESFHFTHAMNAFRREIHVEMDSDVVKPHLRDDAGGIMVLPVNWRSRLSFEDGGYNDGEADSTTNNYTLKDITPESLTQVRSVISDVMLDIPYYLSHHQPKMISAAIHEANRIYREWCKNNPDFEKHGRVHIIAHSLGSVMAIDILSRQPTAVALINPKNEAQDTTDHFIFDTKNLILCGSPAGFFLLLKKANLLPRKHRKKPSTEDDDWAPGVAGEQGEYGCLAVDNLYNVVNPYDPVAYRVNAALDASYAASLKPAFIPSLNTSWLSFSNPFKDSSPPTLQNKRPPMAQRLPSTVELDTHNFSREELAEKRAFLLNDNGQIDYFLKYGGGALEIQYLTMLGAHSSYWTSKDFVRFVVLETGRLAGRRGTIGAMRAVKKKKVYAV